MLDVLVVLRVVFFVVVAVVLEFLEVECLALSVDTAEVLAVVLEDFLVVFTVVVFLVSELLLSPVAAVVFVSVLVSFFVPAVSVAVVVFSVLHSEVPEPELSCVETVTAEVVVSSDSDTSPEGSTGGVGGFMTFVKMPTASTAAAPSPIAAQRRINTAFRRFFSISCSAFSYARFSCSS